MKPSINNKTNFSTNGHKTTAYTQYVDVPLVVDLDGTLTLSDTLHEAIIKFVKQRPFEIWRLFLWLRHGKAGFKMQLQKQTTIDIKLLPYDRLVLEHIEEARKSCRRIVLATAADEQMANSIAGHLPIFDDVIASDGNLNTSGHTKRDELNLRFSTGGYDYIGNAKVDIPIWADCRKAIISNARTSLVKRLYKTHDNVQTLSKRGGRVQALISATRTYQWVKNILIFVPVIASQQISPSKLLIASAAFIFFSLAASSVYLINDLLDLESDRRHPRKKKRALASGKLSISEGFITAIIFMSISIIGAFTMSVSFGLVLVGYLLLSTNYSIWLKRYILIDVMILAGLYTIRLIAGGIATETHLSFWLLGFSLLIFMSLAIAKRYTEVSDLLERGEKSIPGRGYRAGDQAVLMSLGTATGVTSVVALSLYINNQITSDLYSNPMLLWGICPILLYWISRIWISAQRGILTDDPIVFSFRDRASRYMFIGAVVIFILSSWK